MQGNSLLALAGLACAVFNHHNPNSEETRVTCSTSEKYLSTEDWITYVTDTLLTVLDGSVKTFGAPMVWCQQVRYV